MGSLLLSLKFRVGCTLPEAVYVPADDLTDPAPAHYSDSGLNQQRSAQKSQGGTPLGISSSRLLAAHLNLTLLPQNLQPRPKGIHVVKMSRDTF